MEHTNGIRNERSNQDTARHRQWSNYNIHKKRPAWRRSEHRRIMDPTASEKNTEKTTTKRLMDLPEQESNTAFTHKLQPIPNIQDNGRTSGILWIK